LAEDGVPRKVATPVARPEIPVETGRPVTFVITPDVGVPRRGVTNVGLVANTLFPEPVFVTLTSPFDASVATADDAVNELRIGCAVNVAIPVTPKVVLNVPDVNAPVLAVFAPIGTPSIPEIIAPEALVLVAKKERLAEKVI
jgi:hypothetical protein